MKSDELTNLTDTLLDNLLCVAMVLKKGTREIVASNAQARNIGAIPGEKCYEIYGQENKPCQFCLAPEVWETGEPRQIESVKSGDKYYELRWVPYNEELYIHYITDITAHKQTEERLRQSEARFLDLYYSAPVAYYSVGTDGFIKAANKATESYVGYGPGALLNMNVLDLYAEESKARASEIFELFKQGISVSSEEMVYRRKDGQKVYGLLSVTPIKDENDRVLASRSVVVDITEPKQSDLEYKTIIQTTIDGFWLADTQGRFLDVNDTYCRLIGYSCDELLEMNISDIEGIENPEETKVRISRVMETGGDRFETRHRCKDGKIVDVEISVNYINFAGGRMCVFIRDITERKQVEESLANEAIRRHILIEQSRDGIVVLDQNGNVYESNIRFAEMIGYSLEEVNQLNVWDWEYLYPPEQVLEMIRSVDETGDHFETKHRRKDGTAYDVEISTNAAIFAGQKLIFCVCRDITERKRIEDVLQEEQRRLRDALVMGKIGNWEYDVKTKEMYWAEETYTLYERDPALGPPTEEEELAYYSAEQVSMLKDYSERMIKNKEEFQYDLEATLPNGTKKYFAAAAHPILDENGQAVKTFGTVQDITERKQLEELYITLARNSPIGVYIFQDGKYRFVNHQFAQATGFSEEELLNMQPGELVHPEDRERIRNAATQMLKGERTAPYEFRVYGRDGELHWAMETVTSIYYEGRRATLSNFMDITERKKAEEEHDKMEEQLILTDRLASIGELSAGIAHEINNPLTGVIGFSELLMDREDVPDDIKEDLKIINSEAKRTTEIARHLLTFSRKQEVRKTDSNINIIIQNVLDLREYEQRVSNIQIHTSLAPDIPEIIADPSRLQQVFFNIIINAEFFMKEAHGRGDLTITTERVGDIVRASFADNGPGISQDNLAHLFDPFFTTKEVGKGTGLGLSICYGIVTEHGGKLYTESELGKGTTFIVELPITDTEEKGVE